ncbi:TonB-dependent receptor [Natronogracilivirga saccharolytica]|uniref:TonB-dependent receptor n=1 Tax=Natronogracilivirga saccharolytica TaxID=2812953 RepID=A0A8J7RJ94_9BACT|nr:TonB-dependent receptor [Natronogracilivirga saccharolytica]MBP3192247.1 TonB-dependent receptor [Natronogracilivirga saccharolytica]
MSTAVFSRTLITSAFFLFIAVHAGFASGMTEDHSAGSAGSAVSDAGILKGYVHDSETGDPVVLASVYIPDLDRGSVSHDEGDFIIRNIPEGEYRIRFQHVGYESTSKNVTITRDDTTRVSVSMRPSVFRSSEVEIVARHAAEEDDITTYVERTVTGRHLRQQLGRTLAETLEDEPGMAQRSMGPAPARPVLRGLGGDRLLILEDGGRTGDLSATASDHALSIDPMTAEHIELIRGPSAIVHGSNTMGGVINVRRGQIPFDHPDHIHWSGSLQGESVNRGMSGGFRAFGPVDTSLPFSGRSLSFTDRMAFRFDFSGRHTSDMDTPAGSLVNTDITTLNASLGLSYIDDWGVIGFSGNILDSKYGVPGGEGIAEAHPNGVDIEMFRRYLDGRARFNFSDSWARRLDVRWNYSYYFHRELEKPDDPDIPQPVGAEFGVLTNNIRMDLHHRNMLFFEKGLVGVWAEHRDYASGGMTFTPETIERSVAGYLFQERDFRSFNLQIALRYDYRHLSPEEAESIFLDHDITSREFHGASGSVMGSWNITSNLKLGSTITRTHRSPIIEELYSEGPHLANFSYEIGNPALTREKGWGSEVFVRWNRERMRASMAIYRNQMDNYIFPQDTGEQSPRRDDLNVFQYTENKVLMTGAELNYELLLNRSLTTGGTVSYVRGDFIDDGESFPFLVTEERENAVPLMPPLNSRLYLEYSLGSLKIGGAARLATRQSRTDEFEEPTDEYAVFDLYAQYHFSRAGALHTFSFTVENLANSEYRNHLSRIKSVMPEPGRNVKMLYRVYF